MGASRAPTYFACHGNSRPARTGAGTRALLARERRRSHIELVLSFDAIEARAVDCYGMLAATTLTVRVLEGLARLATRAAVGTSGVDGWPWRRPAFVGGVSTRRRPERSRGQR